MGDDVKKKPVLTDKQKEFLKQADKETTAEYLANGGDINVKDEDGNILHHQILRLTASKDPEKGRSPSEELPLMRYLLSQGASAKAAEEFGFTPLHHAAAGHSKSSRFGGGGQFDALQIQIIELLIKNGADVDARNAFGVTPLHCAADNGQVDVMKLLIEKGADIKATTERGSTSLHMAAEHGRAAIELLINKGADVKAVNEYGKTPLHIASHRGDVEAVKLLVEHGADINAVVKVKKEGNAHLHEFDGMMPLHSAASTAQVDAMRFLIEKGANVNSVGREGKTPMHEAATADWSLNPVEAMKFLIEKGGSLSTKDSKGQTPIDLLEKRMKNGPGDFEKTKEQLKEAVKKAIERASTDEQKKNGYTSLAILGSSSGSAVAPSGHGLDSSPARKRGEEPTVAV